MVRGGQARNEELHKRLMDIGKQPATVKTDSRPPQTTQTVPPAKAAFLAEFSGDYGYGGLIDSL
jgi:hypothetical protein